ncbi:hypothetical protein AYI69_g8633, partial [Smittium culicis]
MWATDRGIKSTGSQINLQAIFPEQQMGFQEI